MIKQKDIASILDIDQTYLSKLLNKKRKVSWSLAGKLANILPGKTICDWKNASSEDLKRAFNQLKDMAA
ncbi:helix-turn-helix transcriptional regulator [Desulfobacter postgatei]|uniref:helix-turn-helix domain-containing protein n=1 Tax=Desulfobacter postgatei TaxID=2293 RepID=UPI002FDAAF26